MTGDPRPGTSPNSSQSLPASVTTSSTAAQGTPVVASHDSRAASSCSSFRAPDRSVLTKEPGAPALTAGTRRHQSSRLSVVPSHSRIASPPKRPENLRAIHLVQSCETILILSLDQILIPAPSGSLAARKPSSLLCRLPNLTRGRPSWQFRFACCP